MASKVRTAILTVQMIEDKGVVVHGLTEVMEGIRHALEFPAVRGDVEVALLKVAEGGVKMQRTSSAVAMKL